MYELTQREANKIFAVSRDFAKAIKSFSEKELKTLMYALSYIDFTKEMELKISLDKYELAKFLEINSDNTHLSHDLFEVIKLMPEHSKLQFRDREHHTEFSGFLINYVERCGDKIIIAFEEEAIKYFSNLLNGKFIIMYIDDIKNMSLRAITLYEFFRLHSDTRKTNTHILSTDELRAIFKIPESGKGSYTDKDGYFKRTCFEQQVLLPVCEELSRCKLIKLVVDENNSYYEKLKNRSYVKGYKFTWAVDNSYSEDIIEAKDTSLKESLINKRFDKYLSEKEREIENMIFDV